MNFHSANFPPRYYEWTCWCGQHVPANNWHVHGVTNGRGFSMTGIENTAIDYQEQFKEIETSKCDEP